MVCPRYRYFGDTVNTAARLESKAPWGKIWVSEATKGLLQQPRRYSSMPSMYNWQLMPLGNFWFKGKGNLPVYEVDMIDQPHRNQVLVCDIKDEDKCRTEQVALVARKRMSALLESPSLKLKSSDHTLFARSSPSCLNRLFDWCAHAVSNMHEWHAFRMTVPPSWQTWLQSDTIVFAPDEVLEEDIKYPELTLLLTFTSPKLEEHHCRAEMHKCKRVVVATSLLGIGVIVWSLVAYNVAECDSQEQTALLLHSVIAIVLSIVLSVPLVKQYQWTIQWWPCISLLLLIVFMTWEITLPCGAMAMSSFPVQMGTAFIWMMLANSPFALPFRLWVLSALATVLTFALYPFHEDCNVDPRVIWPECDHIYQQAAAEKQHWSVIVCPALIAMHSFWHNEVSSRRQFVTVLQAHRRRRQAVKVVKSLLPEHVFRMQGQLRNSSMQVNHYIPMVNQLFSDIVGFTSQTAQMKPIAVFEMIATLFGVFDDLTDKLGVLKIETIGDAYWACTGSVSGGDCLPAHATALALFGFKMQEEASKIFPLGPDKACLKIRIGLHSGPVVGGITGTTMPRYHLFGPHVALTNHMETLGSAHYLHATNSFAALLRDDPLCPPDLDVITKDTSLTAHYRMPHCENIKWDQVNRSMEWYGKKLRLDPNELNLLTPVATVTLQRSSFIHVQLTVQGEHVESFLHVKGMDTTPAAETRSDLRFGHHRTYSISSLKEILAL